MNESPTARSRAPLLLIDGIQKLILSYERDGVQLRKAETTMQDGSLC